MPVNSELVLRLLQPIRSDAPAGNDLRYDLRVDTIKEARREDPDLPSNNPEYKRKLADWGAVISLCTKMLGEETKDLQLAVWLTEALMHKEGYAGLATGVTVLNGYLESFWDGLHPLPEVGEDGEFEARALPLSWVGSKLAVPLRMVPFGMATVTFLQIDTAREVPTETEAENSPEKAETRAGALEQGKPAPEAVAAALSKLNKVAVRATLADLDAVRAALTALEKTSDVKFGRDAPSFNELRNSLEEIRRYGALLLEKKLEEDPDPEVVETESDSGIGIGQDGEPISVEPNNRADASHRMGIVAKWFRTQDPANPAPYLMLRGFRWGELRANAPDVDPKLLEAPPTATRSRLKTLLLDAKWSELLEQCESLMSLATGRGWLDLQRYALTACANLGGNYDATAAAIRSELRALLTALPGLTRMTLMDDTPTANEETRAWLASEGLEAGVDEAATASSDSEATDEAIDAANETADVLVDALEDDAAAAHQGGFSRARSVRRSTQRGRDVFDLACGELSLGRPNRAIELLMAELARDQSPRGRMVRQTQIAYVMVEAGLDAVAQPILQRVIEIIDERSLEQWEAGPLVAQPLALMCRVLDRTGGDEAMRAELYLRVCRLDPLQALALQVR